MSQQSRRYKVPGNRQTLPIDEKNAQTITEKSNIIQPNYDYRTRIVECLMAKELWLRYFYSCLESLYSSTRVLAEAL